MNSKPMLPVAAITKHFPRNRTKSPTPLMTAICTALPTSVVKACNIHDDVLSFIKAVDALLLRNKIRFIPVIGYV